MQRALTCPQCNAPLTPGRWARSVVCSYCGTTVQLDEPSTSAALFHEAFRVWNSPQSYALSNWISIGESHWALGGRIASGDVSDVYAGQRARWPTELVIVKLLRERRDAPLMENEWEALQALHRSQAPGADVFTTLLPQPVLHGEVTGGEHVGRRASILRWAGGFRHTFEAVLRAYPRGIPPRASIWAWRRVLEMLSFIHASGMAHGAVVPPHLLVQDGEHGVRLVGYAAAGGLGDPLRTLASGCEAYYPQSIHLGAALSAQLDLIMSARCMAAMLGGDPESGAVPAAVPARLAGLVARLARGEPSDATLGDAWDIREELGRIAAEVYGPPEFTPIVMPS